MYNKGVRLREREIRKEKRNMDSDYDYYKRIIINPR